MAYNFPNSPNNGDTVVVNGSTYTYASATNTWKTTASSGGGGGASVTSSDTAPTSPSDGDLWWNSAEAIMYVYYDDGSSSQWVSTSTPGPRGESGLNVTTSNTAPSSPTAGQFWWNTDVNRLYIYYTDADSSQWVQATTPGADGADGTDGSSVISYTNFAAFPTTNNTAGDFGFAQDTKALYMWDGSEWDRISAGVDESPVIIAEPPATHTLSSTGNTSSITMTAQDPEGFNITYGIAYNTSDGSLPDQLGSATTIDQSNGVYTFTPTSNTSLGGTFKARLSASDGAKTTTRLVSVDIGFDFYADEVLIVAGGGSGSSGGGGGAGGLLYFGTNTAPKTPNGSAPMFQRNVAYTVTVGDGGNKANTGPLGWGGESGKNSLISGDGLTTSTYTAIGGGGGAAGNYVNGVNNNQGYIGGDGGSGGGGGGNGDTGGSVMTGGSGVSGQGYDGGNGSAVANSPAAGGGGAGGVGGNHTTKTGGIGLEYDITGTATYYAGGGGGGSYNAGEGAGGLGGGGDGFTGFAPYNASTDDAVPNTGGGGGGGSGSKSNGGSGIVIIKIPNTITATGTGFTETTTGNSKVLSFTSSGSVTFA